MSTPWLVDVGSDVFRRRAAGKREGVFLHQIELVFKRYSNSACLIVFIKSILEFIYVLDNTYIKRNVILLGHILFTVALRINVIDVYASCIVIETRINR